MIVAINYIGAYPTLSRKFCRRSWPCILLCVDRSMVILGPVWRKMAFAITV